uniref:Glycogen debranching enzyme n=1 Tax=Panagrellus redivivus TaxID=6233 RepID=A0A7E4ZV10_PANRE
MTPITYHDLETKKPPPSKILTKEGIDDTYKFGAFGFDIAAYPDDCTVHLDNEEEAVSDVLAAPSNHVLPEFRLRTDGWNSNNVRFPDRPLH